MVIVVMIEVVIGNIFFVFIYSYNYKRKIFLGFGRSPIFDTLKQDFRYSLYGSKREREREKKRPWYVMDA